VAPSGDTALLGTTPRGATNLAALNRAGQQRAKNTAGEKQRRGEVNSAPNQ
jgi:hypothetical protein